jgi:photosystem II stability/assembly factor-like uncharacterized protein
MNGPYGGSIGCIKNFGTDLIVSLNDSAYEGEIFISNDTAKTWRSISNGLPLTYTYAVEKFGGKLFAGTAGGLYLSTDNGDTWTVSNNGLPFNPKVLSFTIFASKIYVATLSGVGVSVDTGNSWTVVNNGLLPPVTRVFSNSSGLFAGSENNGIFFSSDSGNTWTPMTSGLPSNIYVNCIGTNGSDIFLGTEMNGVYMSSNNGTSWNYIGTPGFSIHDLLAVGTDIYAATENGVSKTTDTGATWNSVYTSRIYHGVLSLGYYAGHVFAGDQIGLFSSTNSGANWTLAGCPRVHVRSFTNLGSMIFCNGRNFYNNLDPVYLSVDNGLNWQSKSNGITNYDVRELAAKDSNLFACNFDNGVIISRDSGNTWTVSTNGITNLAVKEIEMMGDNIIVGSNWNNNAPGILFLSQNNGASWTDISPGTSTINLNGLYIQGNNIFAATDSIGSSFLYFSSDTGNTWTMRSTGLPFSGYRSFASIGTDLYVSEYLSTADGIYFSSDSGLTWSQLTNGLPANAQITTMCEYNGNLFAAVYDYSPSAHSSIYLSTDNGNSWINTGGDVPNIEVFTMKAIGGDLFLGTLGSVFRSSINDILLTANIKNNTFNNFDLEIYPTPSTDQFTIRSKNIEKNDILEIYDLIGRKVQEEVLLNKTSNTVRLKNIPAGIYFVTVSGSGNRLSGKIIIQ